MALCAAVLAVAWRPWRAESADGAGRWAGALGFGAAFLAAAYATGACGRFPPVESWQWIVYLAAAAAIIGAAEANGWLRGARWPVLAVFAGGAVLLVGSWVPAYRAWQAGALAIVAALLAVLEAMHDRRGASIPFALCLAFTGASVILLLAENLKLALLAGAIAASLGAATSLAWWRPRMRPLAGAMPLLAVTLPGLLLSGKFLTYSAVPAWSFIFAAAAPIGLLVDRRPGLRIVGVAAAVVIAIAGAMATPGALPAAE